MAAKTGETDSISLAIVGSGGAGALTTGAMLLEIAGKCGLYGMMTRSVGPQMDHHIGLREAASRPIL